MDLPFQAHPAHTEGLSNPVLVVDKVLLGNDVDDLPVEGHGDRLGGIDDPIDVGLGHLPILDGDYTVGVETLYVAPGNADVDAIHIDPSHKFGLLHGALGALYRAFDIDHHALANPPGGIGADAYYIELAVLAGLADDRTNLGRADVQATNHFSSSCHFLTSFLRGQPASGSAVSVRSDPFVLVTALDDDQSVK